MYLSASSDVPEREGVGDEIVFHAPDDREYKQHETVFSCYNRESKPGVTTTIIRPMRD